MLRRQDEFFFFGEERKSRRKSSDRGIKVGQVKVGWVCGGRTVWKFHQTVYAGASGVRV
jgi:hypothetical protein